jgi:hypothetical protein
MANHPPEKKKTSRGRKDLYAIGDQRTRPGGNKERNMVPKTVLLINEEGEQCWLEEKDNGSLWQGDGKIFASEIEANIRGWKVDALKVVFKSTAGNDKGA